MTCYLVTSPFEDCSCHSSDVHETTQAESAESLVEELVAAESDAWNKGDAHAFSTRCTEDISFTNIIGTSYYGRAAFEERSIKRLCFIRADVATADDRRVSQCRRRAITCSRAIIREEVPRHGTGTVSNSEVAFCVPFGTEGATDQRRSCRASSHSFDALP
jgi:hypothetical protein